VLILLLLLLFAGGTLVPYMLDEDKNWGLSMDSLKAAVKKARSEGKAVRGLVFINPGGHRPTL
jgi:aspartate/methionine/tyrosine aminotransferase